MYFVITALIMIMFWTIIIIGTREGKFITWFFSDNGWEYVKPTDTEKTYVTKFDKDYAPLIIFTVFFASIVVPVGILAIIGYILGKLVYKAVRRFI